MGLRHNEKIPHPETDFSWPINKKVYYFSEYRASHETPKHKYKPKLKKKQVYLICAITNIGPFSSLEHYRERI